MQCWKMRNCARLLLKVTIRPRLDQMACSSSSFLTTSPPTLFTSSPPPLLQCRVLYFTSLIPERLISHTPKLVTMATSRNLSTSSRPPGDDEEGMMKRSWRKLATLVSAFMSGTKGLYKDVREMYELKKRQRLVVTGMAPQKTGSDTTDFGFTRSEYQFIYQTQRDLWKMLPTIILFFVPFFGYFVPLIVFMYPHRMLSSHFLTKQQKLELQQASSSLRHEHLNYLLTSRSEIFKKFNDLEIIFKRLEEGHTRGQVEEEEEEEDEKLEREDVEGSTREEVMKYSLRNIKTSNLEALGGMWGVSAGLLPRLLPLLQGSALRSKLDQHLCYIFTSDCLLHLEGGVKQLNHHEIEKLCSERCLTLGDKKEMEKYLQRWISISTQFQEVQPYLLALLPLYLHSRH